MSTSLQNVESIRRFIRLCQDGSVQGWHEANGGNASYRMNSDDIAACAHAFTEGEWQHLSRVYNTLAGNYFMVTGSGMHLRNAALEPACTFGIVEIDADGASWRVVWGLEGVCPSSELETHFSAYEVADSAHDGANRIVYHAHCPNIIALSIVLDADMRIWTRALWKCMTESIIVFPQGIGVVPWKIPGSADLAQATCELMKKYRICVWTQHGLMVRASSFDEAFGLTQTIEKSAGVYLQACAASGGGAPRHLVSDDQLRAVCARYGITPNEDYLD